MVRKAITSFGTIWANGMTEDWLNYTDDGAKALDHWARSRRADAEAASKTRRSESKRHAIERKWLGARQTFRNELPAGGNAMIQRQVYSSNTGYEMQKMVTDVNDIFEVRQKRRNQYADGRNQNSKPENLT